MDQYTPCAPGARCGRWRSCPRCEGIRQARIADRAERGHQTTGGALTHAVVTPDCPRDTARIRASITRHLPARGGLWAVHTGEQTRGLHVHLIAAADDTIDAVHIAAACDRPASVWSAPLPAAGLRSAAAYISRAAAAPSQDEYRGRLVGTWGGWRSVRDVMVSAAAAPQSPAPLAVRAAVVAAEIERGDCDLSPTTRAAALAHIRGLLDALRS